MTTHYGPKPTADLPARRCRALCGVEYEIGGEPAGSSNLKHVDCCECLDVVEARKKIGEAGE